MTIAWIYLDKRSATVEALKDYTSMLFILQHQPEALEEAEAKKTSLPSAIPTGMPRGTNLHAVESRLVAAIDEIDVLKERYRRALEYMDWFQPAWDALSADEQFVLTEFYAGEDGKQSDTIGNICDYFHIERSSAYNKKNRALARLTLLLYGK